MGENYNDIVKVRIGRVAAKVVTDNYFPVVGETVKMDAATRWGQSSEWQTQDGSGSTVTAAGNLALQKDSKQVKITGAGELKQRFIGRNSISEAEVVKAVYAMQPQALPYFDIDYSNTSEVIRAGSDNGRINLVTENGYSKSLQDSEQTSVQIRIYKENETANPVVSKSYENDLFTIRQRGIYDVEVDVTDLESGITLRKRINKLITVTPELCPKPADTTRGYEVAFTYRAYTSYVNLPGTQEFECRLWRNVDNSGLNYAEMVIPQGNPTNGQWDGPDCSMLPAGTTLVIKRDPQEPEDYPMRLFLKGNKSQNESNENGTPNFTREAPLVITHDETDVMQWGWRAYGAFSPGNNMRNVVIDGYGYHNTGIHFYPFDSSMFVDSCLFINNGSSYFEIFGLDIDGAGFAGISAKTDPNPNMPWFWRENGWEMFLDIHHCTFRNTVGEGCYIGYFDTSAKSGSSADGEVVVYHAHVVRDLRIYRCGFLNNGYDSVQINNACGVEFCYNTLDGCGYRREPSQGSAFSCTMDGRIYNCTVKNNYNIIGVFGPFLSGLEIFNCILTAARLEPGWVLTAWTSETNPEEMISGKFYNIHNNVVKSSTIARLTGNVSYEGYTMDDNIFITENGDTEAPGYFTGSGNIFLTADLDYENIDTALKVADSANYNYQPAYNSPAVTAGKNGKSLFDMRGYKNWYIGRFHAGPLMGKYKDVSVVDVELALTGIRINEGAASTYVREVNVLLQYNGTPTRYRIGETADLSGVAWSSLGAVENGVVKYTLSDNFGPKTVYAQVGNVNQESVIVSSAIEYLKEPVMATMVLNGGKTMTTDSTIPVSFDVRGVYASLEYMLSEDAGFAGAAYASYDAGEEVLFALSSGKGLKTVYGRIKSDDGQQVTMEGTVDYVNDRLILAMYEAKSDKDVFDGENGITRRRGWPTVNQQLYGVSNKAFCKFSFIANGPEIKGLSTVSNNSTTGDNSGTYPDIYLAYSLIFSPGHETAENVARVQFSELPPGNYRLRILCNGNAGNWPPDSAMKSYILVNEEEYLVADKGLETFTDNFTRLMEWDVTVGEDGLLTVGAYCTTKWRTVPVNIIEIEEV